MAPGEVHVKALSWFRAVRDGSNESRGEEVEESHLKEAWHEKEGEEDETPEVNSPGADEREVFPEFEGKGGDGVGVGEPLAEGGEEMIGKGLRLGWNSYFDFDVSFYCGVFIPFNKAQGF